MGRLLRRLRPDPRCDHDVPIVNGWTWCPDCKAGTPPMQGTYRNGRQVHPHAVTRHAPKRRRRV